MTGDGDVLAVDLASGAAQCKFSAQFDAAQNPAP